MESRLAVSFGKVVDRERKHQGEEASGHQGASKKEASGMRGARALRRRVARAFLGLFNVLGRLTLGLVPSRPLGWADWLGEPSPGP